ncbi:MAG: hypothetical protein QOJ95_4755 [Mycobacterium sp.]|jgi:hypothetical protein|nr:hypothetical protein [Mycobacterium sp.]
MNTTAKGLLKTLATRSVVAALPVAMITAYASGIFTPPHRNASFDFMPVAEINVSPSTVGVAESPLYGMSAAQINEQLDQLQALGVENIRVFVPWGLVEYQNDTYDWSNLDLVMKAAAARNMGVLAEVNATPAFAATTQDGFPGTQTPDTGAYADFLKAFINHQVTVDGAQVTYGSIVSAYEVWNEPNSIQFSNPIDPVAYAQLLAAAYPAIKQLDPTATVVAGALGTVQTTGFTMSPVDYVQQMLAAGAGQYFDALSVHPYLESLQFSDGNNFPPVPGFLTPLQQVDAIKAMIGTGKSIWISEYGLPTVAGAADEAKQSQYIMDLINYWQTYSQAGPIFLYTGRDTATGSVTPDDNYGLYYQNGDPKDVVAALAAYYAAHPQNPTTPTDPTDPTDPPTNPANAIAQFFQQLAQQIGQAIANAFGQQIVTALVSAISNFLASLGAPAATTTTAAPQTLKVASVEAPAVSSLKVAAATSTEAVDTSAKSGSSQAPDASGAEEAAAVAQAPAATTAVAAPAEAAPVATTPVATTPEVTTPVVKTPEVTAPVATKPESTSPATTPSTASSSAAPKADKGDPDGGPKSGDKDGKGRAPKSGDSDKGARGATDGTGADKSGPSSRYPRGKGNNGFGGAGAKPAGAEAASAGAGAVTASSSAG